MDQNGFGKIVKKKFTNLNEDWLDLEIKLTGGKMSMKLNDKVLFNGLEEPEPATLKTKSGTYMFGVNNDKVMFADIKMN